MDYVNHHVPKPTALTYLHDLRGRQCRLTSGLPPQWHDLGFNTRLYHGCLAPGCKLCCNILICQREVIDMGLGSCLLEKII